jgi:hypothetical protein
MGAMAAALDTTAGERERGSLEPLLTTPTSPIELATGKWLALCVLDALVVAVTLGGFYLTLRFAPLPSVGIPFLFGFRQYAAFMAILVPLIFLSTAILLYVGLRGRSVKEAQANLSVLMFAASILPVVQMFMRRKDPEWLLSVPIAGQYALLSRVLRGDALVFQEWLQAFAIPSLLALAALLLAARLLSKESVLAGRSCRRAARRGVYSPVVPAYVASMRSRNCASTCGRLSFSVEVISPASTLHGSVEAMTRRTRIQRGKPFSCSLARLARSFSSVSCDTASSTTNGRPSPTSITCSKSGSCRIASSTSCGDSFSPLESTSTSLARPRRWILPSLISARSPVCSQPSASSAACVAGSLRQ